MVFPKAAKDAPALHRGMLNTLNASYQNRSAITKLWGVAEKCPLFSKKVAKKVGDKGKRRVRGNRALSSHTIKSLASGATANAVALIEAEAALLRNDTVKEVARYPVLPSVGKAAASLFETAVIAYIQEAFNGAAELKDAVGKHKKITNRCMQVATDALNGRIARSTGLLPERVVTKMPFRARKTRAKKAAGEAVVAE